MYRLDGQIPLSLNQFSCVIADNYALPITPISIKKKNQYKTYNREARRIKFTRKRFQGTPIAIGANTVIQPYSRSTETSTRFLTFGEEKPKSVALKRSETYKKLFKAQPLHTKVASFL